MSQIKKKKNLNLNYINTGSDKKYRRVQIKKNEKKNDYPTDKSVPKDCMQIDCDLRISNHTRVFHQSENEFFTRGKWQWELRVCSAYTKAPSI